MRIQRLPNDAEPPKATLHLHFPCFDGLISAVLASDFLENALGWEIGRFCPVNYNRLGKWRSEELALNSAVVDFLYHPEAFFWADHHITSFTDESDRSALNAQSGRILIYDPNTPSCALLLWDYLRDKLSSPERYQDMVFWANKIDSARYDSVDEAIFGSNPAMEISQSLAILNDEEACDLLVRSLRKGSLEQVSSLPQIRDAASEVRRRVMAGLDAVGRSIRMEAGDIAVFEADQDNDLNISRYSPYYFFPEARYSVALVRSADGAKITAMRNPWRNFQSVPLGKIFEQFGGGGHERVASVLIGGTRSMDVTNVLGQLIQLIRLQDRALTSA